MNQITPLQFQSLNDEQGYESLRGVIGNKTSYERGIALYDYICYNFELPAGKCSHTEQMQTFIQLQILKHAQEFREKFQPAYLSPNQFDYVSKSVFNLMVKNYRN